MAHKRMIKNFVTASFASIVVWSCADDTLPKPSQLDSMRVLALTSTSAEFSLGDSVTVTPVISDLSAGSGASFTYRWRSCWDPGVGFGAEPACEDASWTNVTASVLNFATDAWTGAETSFNVNIPAVAPEFSLRSTQAQFNGISYLIEFELIRNDGLRVKAFRRLVVSTNATKNANPAAPNPLLNGASLIALPLSEVTLVGAVNTSSVQNYLYYTDSGELKSRNEDVIVSWFASDGTFKPGVSDINASVKFKGPSAAPSGRTAVFVLIARDNRGGVSVDVKKF
jgi:hypothetical protein